MGTSLFTAASILCALAPSLELLLAARAVQGVGAALLLPNSLALLNAAYEGEKRGRAVGFWVRRGRPGIIAHLLQALGARVFRDWYVRNAPWALSPPLYDAAREHVKVEILADPTNPLDDDARRALEEWFASRSGSPSR